MSHGPNSTTDPSALLNEWSEGRILQDGRDASFCRLLSASLDLVLQEAWRSAGSIADTVCLVAAGGYGRFEVTPGGDVDLWVVFDSDETKPIAERLKPFVSSVLKAGLVPAVRYFSREEFYRRLREDMKVRVSCFDLRVLAGDSSGALTREVEKAVLHFEPGNTMRFLRSETEERREELRSHWFLKEPNLKLSEGGLRDLHSIRWIQRLLAENGLEIPEDQKTTLVESHRFLLWLRSLLHKVVQENNDTLTLEAQRAVLTIAKSEGVSTPDLETEKALLSAYHQHARHVAWTLRRWLAWGDEWFHTRGAPALPDRRVPAEEGVVIRGGRLGLERSGAGVAGPASGLRLYRAVAHTGLKLHHSVYFDIKRSLDEHEGGLDGPSLHACYSILVDLVCLPDHGTRALEGAHDAGLLDWCFPALGQLRDSGEGGGDRLYTEDVHALRTIDALKRAALGAGAGDRFVSDLLRHGYSSDPVLYTALLFLPIAQRAKNDKEAVSAELEKFCANAGKEDSLVGEVLLLIENYGGFMRTARSPDWTDRGLGRALARDVSSTSQLDRLYLMAFANLAASNQAMITSWRYAQIKSLYQAIRVRMTKGLGLWTDDDASVREMSRRVIQLVLGHTPFGDDPEKDRIESHFSRLPTRYARMVGPEDVCLHMDLLEDQKRGGGNRIALRFRRARRASSGTRAMAFQSGRSERTEIVLASTDRHKLLLAVCCGMTDLGANIRSAYVFRTLDDLVLQVFVVEGLSSEARERAGLMSAIEANLEDLDARPAPWHAPIAPRATTTALEEVSVDLESKDESDFLSLSVHGTDRKGILVDLLRVTDALRLELPQIYLWTEGASVRGKILLSELDGAKPTGDARTEDVLKRVRAVFTKPKEQP